MRYAIRFAVCLLRHPGRPLPWRDVFNHPALVGDLRIEETRDRELRRYVRTARLFRNMEILQRDDRPTLLDVRVVAVSPQAFTLARIERVDGAEYAQSWLVQFASIGEPACVWRRVALGRNDL